MRLTQSMYEKATCRMRVGCNPSEEFIVKVGIHQGSYLSPLLFIAVQEALTQEFSMGCPRGNLYADDPVIITESMKELHEELILWNTNIQGKGLRGNMGETKVLMSEPGLGVLQKSCKNHCGVCPRGVSTNSVFCGGCPSWIYKKCSGISGPLKLDASFRCKRCTGQDRPLDVRLMTEVTLGHEKLEVAPSSCYLGDYLSLGGSYEFAAITRFRVAWGQFNELLSVLTSRLFPITSR